jgi:hypothetical protein
MGLSLRYGRYAADCFFSVVLRLAGWALISDSFFTLGKSPDIKGFNAAHSFTPQRRYIFQCSYYTVPG